MRKSIGMKLKKLRENRNLTIRDVSRLTGLGVNTISRWENDKVLPKIKHLSVLATFYGVGLSYFGDSQDSFDVLNYRVGVLETRIQTISEKIEKGSEPNERGSRR